MRTASQLAAVLAHLSIFSGALLAADEPRPQEPLFARVVATDVLSAQRGGAAVQVNVMDLTAKLTDNVARNTVNGANVIASGAFANASGFATVIQNSGNNVIIQNATLLNLEMK